ncbi:MAG: S8 family serine peptidase [Planctomycetaceae bacterium]|nr:S8 family serine peptidase [Planctomycetaceae bacterium]
MASRFRALCGEPLEERRLLTAVDALESSFLLDGTAEGESAGNNFVNGQLLVQFKPGTTQEQIQEILAAENATVAQTFYGLDNMALVNLPWYTPDQSNPTPHYVTWVAAQNWDMKPQIEFAEPNFYRQPTAIPNDPLYPWLWGLNNNGTLIGTVPDADIDAAEAWDLYTGSESVVVAVLDSGVDYTHPDLAGNMWINPGEIPGNGIDDDGNGWIDDVYGIAPGVGATNGDPLDRDRDSGHGTHVAGTIGAVGNNGIGVTGVNWDVQIMALNVLFDSAGALSGTSAVIVAGLSYVTMMKQQYGVNIVASNHSYGGAGESNAERAAIEAHIAAGISYVCAAGNDSENNDTVPAFPASYDIPGMITVAASTYAEMPADYSNYGKLSVDLFAPGSQILSTAPPYITSTDLMMFEGAGYQYLSGTSMASPHVTGAAALLRALAPELSVAETRQLLLNSVDQFPQYAPYVVTGGRLNVNNAVSQIKTTGVSGVVYMDRNGNGVRDPAEAGIAGWTVYLDVNRNGVMDSRDPYAVTDATGAYTIITTAVPGTYTVGQVLQPSWTAINPASGKQTVTITRRGDVVSGVNFGNMPLPGVVSGVKWHDLDGDGIKDPKEPGIPGVYIYADLNNDGQIALGEPAAVTGADGSYSISGIPAGQITIREVPSPGWSLTSPALGYHVVDVVANGTVPNVNFGNVAAFDYGDAPAPYLTLSSQGGAAHGILPGFMLGTLIDAEPNGLPSPLADGDDLLNLADEDGIVFPAALYAGTTATLGVTVTSTSYPQGFLQGWIDFNQDGDWTDAGEHVICDRVLGTGVYQIPITVPSNAVVGHTYARFRFSSDANLAPSGRATAGEVEDYRLLVLSNEPVANPDSYEVPEGAIRQELNVLANDFASSTGVLAIVSVTQPARGNVQISPDRKSLLYSAQSAVSPPVETFTYTISDGTGAVSTAEVTVFVRPQVLTPIAVDDSYRLATGAQILDVLRNDLPGVLGTMQLTSVTNPTMGTAVIDNNGTPDDPLDDVIIYTPDASFDGIDKFQYTISNANGSSTATVTIIKDPAGEQTVDLVFDIVDLNGTPISQVNVGDEFVLVASVQDTRDVAANTAGIYAVYMDVLYDRTLVTANYDAANSLGFAISFTDEYSNALSGDVDTPGIVNEVGAIQTGFDPLGPDLYEVFRIVFTAVDTGTVEFVGDPADVSPSHDVLYYHPPDVVSPADIQYGLKSLTIVDPHASGAGTGGGTPLGEPLDVNFDGFISPIDALLVINHLNRGGTPGVRLDVNRDKHVSPLDALLIVNYLNRRDGLGEGAGESAGEGEALDAVAGTASEGFAVGNLAGAVQGTTVAMVAASPASAAAVPGVPDAAADWQARIGQAPTSGQLSSLVDVANEQWESLLDLLAEDVLAAWLDGE